MTIEPIDPDTAPVVVDAAAAVVLAELATEGERLDREARAKRTWGGYQADWNHFTAWCAGVDLEALPATPATVALYLADAAKSFKVSTLKRRVAAISVVHQGYGHPSPTFDVVVRTRMKGIARDKADEQVTRKAPAWGRDVRRMVADQEGAGRTIGIPYGSHPSSCPVRAFRAWRAVNHVDTGSLFRRIHGNATLGKRLSSKSVALIVKGAAERVGLDPAHFAGHSLRAGFVTSAADGGSSEAAIMEQTGHRSTKQLRDYMRDGRLFHNNAAAVTGL